MSGRFGLEEHSNILITGDSSGLGQGFREVLLNEGHRVFAMSRRKSNIPAEQQDRYSHYSIDLSHFNAIDLAIDKLFGDVKHLHLVILNAGILGEIGDMKNTTLPEFKKVMDVNVWSNQALCRRMYARNIKIDRVIAISSGAAVNGNRGWNAYAISKAALNMWVQLMAAERTDTHYISLAPGLIDTDMQEYLCNHPADDRFPSLEKLKAARGTEDMPLPFNAAERLLNAYPKMMQMKSGSFTDIRSMEQ